MTFELNLKKTHDTTSIVRENWRSICFYSKLVPFHFSLLFRFFVFSRSWFYLFLILHLCLVHHCCVPLSYRTTFFLGWHCRPKGAFLPVPLSPLNPLSLPLHCAQLVPLGPVLWWASNETLKPLQWHSPPNIFFLFRWDASSYGNVHHLCFS